ncbi:hypothetical protein [Campylobacter concisus]
MNLCGHKPSSTPHVLYHQANLKFMSAHITTLNLVASGYET